MPILLESLQEQFVQFLVRGSSIEVASSDPIEEREVCSFILLCSGFSSTSQRTCQLELYSRWLTVVLRGKEVYRRMP